MKISRVKEIIREEIQMIVESDETLQKIADIAKNTKLVSMRKELEKMFGRKNIEVLGGDMPLPPIYYQIKYKGKKIIIIHKKYVDGADLVIGDTAIGYL